MTVFDAGQPHLQLQPQLQPAVRLSICIATRNRADLLAQTLDRMLEQCVPGVEIVVVDGASSDATPEVMADRCRKFGALRYLPQWSNSGLDGDFDKTIEAASGEYCWLFSDDDFILPGGIERVLATLEEQAPDALIVDARVLDSQMERELNSSRLGFVGIRRYGLHDMARFLSECGDHLSFIGCVVVRRALWLSRDRARYYGSEFVHVGVLFQAPLVQGAVALGEPLVAIRYGVGNWVRRAFEVWMFKWPRLVWSFDGIDESARAAVVSPEPWRKFRKLLVCRAYGWYTLREYRALVRPQSMMLHRRWIYWLIACVPGSWVNAAIRHYLGRGGDVGVWHDLENSPFFRGVRQHADR